MSCERKPAVSGGETEWGERLSDHLQTIALTADLRLQSANCLNMVCFGQ
jgi:hypothetical protein